MTARLAGKRAIVTAAGQGIGRAVVAAFAREGADVFATDINAGALTQLASEHRNVRVQTLDVTDRDAIRAFATQHESASTAFDVLFNCVGIVQPGTLLECTTEQLQLAWQLNVVGMFNMCQALLPGMIAAKRGSIINMSSVASSIKAVPNRFAYSTTKAAIIGMTKSIAADFLQAGIRCNAICPGTIDTPSLNERIAAQARLDGKRVEEIRAQFVARQPMGRLGHVDEVAALAVYLASDEAAFTTGTIHVIDGGWTN
jgi:2-keto-3-deoxy-L-fuconate dehydrogenase